MKPSEAVPAPDPLYAYANKIEVEMLEERIDDSFQLLAELRNAMCDASHDLVVDYAGLLRASRAINLHAVHIRSIAMVIEKRQHGNTASQF